MVVVSKLHTLYYKSAQLFSQGTKLNPQKLIQPQNTDNKCYFRATRNTVYRNQIFSSSIFTIEMMF